MSPNIEFASNFAEAWEHLRELDEFSQNLRAEFLRAFPQFNPQSEGKNDMNKSYKGTRFELLKKLPLRPVNVTHIVLHKMHSLGRF